MSNPKYDKQALYTLITTTIHKFGMFKQKDMLKKLKLTARTFLIYFPLGTAENDAIANILKGYR